jgi:hypothetical protein
VVSSVLHLDLFHLDEGDVLARIAAWAWLVVYVAEPPLLLLAFVLQLRAPGGNPARSDPLPWPLGVLLWFQAALLVVLGTALFAAPLDVAEIWPWQLTELTARAIAAWLVAVGGLLAAIAWEGDRGRIRLGLRVPIAFVALEAVALARYGDELDWPSPEAVVLLAALAVLGLTGVWSRRVSSA